MCWREINVWREFDEDNITMVSGSGARSLHKTVFFTCCYITTFEEHISGEWVLYQIVVDHLWEGG